MAINVATLTAKLDTDIGGFKRGLSQAGTELDGFQRKNSGILGKLGGAMATAAKVGGVAAVAAIGAIGVKGVTAFAGFEKEMNDVFTLLPGISEKAMDEMSEQALALSQEMGILPEEVVPALYQSLSAGVPPDNVFEFMETASKAAIGGSVDLETAVDGVTSTVNAFGSEVIGAAEASDVMFTAVRLGKTTMGELSKSLFQVNPIAAGLGIKFSDVGASLAALTSQGVPTSVAATQIRSAFVEMGKSGTKASKVFEKTAGVTFKKFIAEGGNVHEAFEIMNDAAKDMDVGVNDLFGSVEAGSAVLALTSEVGAAAFSNALHEMDESAGATEAAFGTMDKGLSRSWDKIKATATGALIKIGNKLAPFIEKAAEWLGEKLPGAIDTLMGWFEKIGPAVGDVARWLGEMLPKAAAFFQEQVLPILKRVAEFLSVAIPAAVRFMIDAWNTISPVVTAVFGIVKSVIETVVGWFSSDATAKVGEGSSGMIAKFQEIWEKVGPIFDKIVKVISTAIELIVKVIGKAWEIISAIWETHGESIMSFVTTIFGVIVDVISGALSVIQGVMDVVMGIIDGDWSRVWEGIKGILSGVWEAMKALVGLAIEAVKASIGLAMDALVVSWELVWNGIKSFVGSIWDGIKSVVATAAEAVRAKIAEKITAARNKVVEIFNAIKTTISNTIDSARNIVQVKLSAVANLFRDKFQEAVNWVKTKLGQVKGEILHVATNAFHWAWSIGSAIVRGILGGIGNLASSLYNKLRSAVSGAVSRVKRVFGIRSPSKVLMAEVGVPLAQGVSKPMEDVMKGIRGSVGAAAPATPSLPVIPGGGGGITVIVEGNLFGASSVDDLVDIIEAGRRDRSLRGGALV